MSPELPIAPDPEVVRGYLRQRGETAEWFGFRLERCGSTMIPNGAGDWLAITEYHVILE